jgi:DnaK suppressor protein
MLTKELVHKFKKIFEDQKNNLVFTKSILNEDFHFSKDDLKDETDMTSTEIETNMRYRLRTREAILLKKIDEALDRIREGTFGVCQGCEENIEIKRLEARPTTDLCLNCKELEERKEQIHIGGHRHKSIGSKLRLA